MSDKSDTDWRFALVIVAAVFLFWGDPDVHDLVMEWLKANSEKCE